MVCEGERGINHGRDTEKHGKGWEGILTTDGEGCARIETRKESSPKIDGGRIVIEHKPFTEAVARFSYSQSWADEPARGLEVAAK